ncbi:MAG: hypothetical protein AB7E30_11090 [Lawsonibacter sp.]
MILKSVWEDPPHDDDGHGDGGTMIVDATCTPSHIRHPQDTSLLNGALENMESCWTSYIIPRTKKALRLFRSGTPGSSPIQPQQCWHVRFGAEFQKHFARPLADNFRFLSPAAAPKSFICSVDMI